MKKVLLASAAIVAFAGAAVAQDVSGFVEFEAQYSDNSDEGNWEDVEFAVDSQLNIRGSYATKAGLEYGYNVELDMEQKDGSTIEVDNSYVWVSSSMGRLDFGHRGNAGAASSQLNVPLLTGEIDVSDYSESEDEVVKYSNSFMGFDVSASTDDDGEWALGFGYGANMGAMAVKAGVTIGQNDAAGSISMSSGSITAGISYAGSSMNAVVDGDGDSLDFNADGTPDWQSGREYMSAGIGYDAGALKVGVGIENQTTYYIDGATLLNTEDYDSRLHAGATYEIADGLTVGAAVAIDDNDDMSALGSVKVAF